MWLEPTGDVEAPLLDDSVGMQRTNPPVISCKTALKAIAVCVVLVGVGLFLDYGFDPARKNAVHPVK